MRSPVYASNSPQQQHTIRGLERVSDDLIFNNADGSVSHKACTINSVKSGEIKFDSIAISEGNVQDFGGTGVVTLKLAEKAIDVWVKRDGRWQNVAGQETRCIEYLST